jgi:hypothetical protein
MANKKEFNEYQNLMKQKFDLEDKMKTIGHDIWLKKNENIQAGKQLALVEDQLRLFFDRKRLEFDEEEDEGKG